jgi:hypothetical protein
MFRKNLIVVLVNISELTDFLFNVKGFETDFIYSAENLYFFAKDFLTKN